MPLAQRGVPVHGIDLSNAMVARLREKSGAEEIGVTIGDFATARAEGTFAVAYLVFNTLMNLRTQPEQVACFRNVAGQLEPGGCFVLEVMVADLQRLPPGESSRPFDLSAESRRAGRVRRRDAGAALPSLHARGRQLGVHDVPRALRLAG